jgi:hypothetical protein
MDLLEKFCEELGICYYGIPSELSEDIDYTVDNSGFTVVDGEEGDYGIIKYLSKNNELIAIHHIYGGDSEDIEFTELGKALLRNKVIEIINYKIEKL